MSRLTALLAALLLAPAVASAEAPKVTVAGTVDGYYALYLTTAQDYISPTGGVSAFSGFNFNYARVATTAEAGPATLRLDLAYGPEGQTFTGFPPGGAPPAGHISRLLVEQALIAMKFGRFDVEAGRFLTPAGFEAVAAKDNWLYSQGLVRQFAIPKAHEGVRVSTAVEPELTLTASLANGSDLFTNDTGISQSPYKTLILGGRYLKGDTAVKGNIFISKDPATAGDAFLLDVVFTQAMGPTAFTFSGDYGKLDSSDWFALGAWIKHDLGKDGLKIVGRIEYLDDSDGIHTGVPLVNGNVAKFMSFTGGVNYPVGSNAELRAELRLDRATEKVYAPVADPSESVVTFTASALAWF